MSDKKEVVSLIGDMKRDEAIVHLITKEKMTLKDAEAHWKLFGAKKNTTFYAGFYEELEEGAMDDKRFDEIVEAGSQNVKNHKKMYDNIRVLTNAIHATYAEG